ncbi:hypothetical protein BV25DRAFT_1836664 [Artomyces pyxidatus]|uniref:Uncharacterized protein n=1 Tax=Artomyces pyxidatus TaxID=48021 RepID=A0ACB8T8K7_9AGAM|nr:hypothetical protein BV25DRAFT_1836664 [Artomyces pyxidatus]
MFIQNLPLGTLTVQVEVFRMISSSNNNADTRLSTEQLRWHYAHTPALPITEGTILERVMNQLPDKLVVGRYLGCDDANAYFHLSGNMFLQVPRSHARIPDHFVDRLTKYYPFRSPGRTGYEDIRVALANPFHRLLLCAIRRRTAAILRRHAVLPMELQVQCFRISTPMARRVWTINASPSMKDSELVVVINEWLSSDTDNRLTYAGRNRGESLDYYEMVDLGKIDPLGSSADLD